MKKLIIAAAALAMGFAANAACVNWKVTGTSDTESYTILLFTEKPASQYDTVADLKNAAVATAEIVKKGTSRVSYTTGDQITIADSVTTSASFYMAILADDSAKTFDYASVSMSGNVYDVGQDPKATFSTTAASISGNTGTIGKEEPTPEPTSGLLMLLGMAGLALRRKQK